MEFISTIRDLKGLWFSLARHLLSSFCLHANYNNKIQNMFYHMPMYFFHVNVSLEQFRVCGLKVKFLACRKKIAILENIDMVQCTCG